MHAQVLQHCLLIGLGLRALFACSGFVATAELDSKWLRTMMMILIKMMMRMMMMMVMMIMMMIMMMMMVMMIMR